LFDRPGELQPYGPDQIRRQPAHLANVALGKGLALPPAPGINGTVVGAEIDLAGYSSSGRWTRPEIGPALSSPTARSADGSAEPLGQLAEQILLVFTDPRHVAVGPQQRRGHVQFLADVDDVVDPLCPARHREPAGLVEE
jgi:hypothetical protein